MRGKLLPLRPLQGEITELSDEALLAACGTHDAAALGALFDRFHRDIYRFAGRFPWIDESGRDDLVQTTFLEIQRSARTYRGESSVRTWIMAIATNLARQTLRGERRRWVRQAKYLEQPTSPPRLVDEEVERRRLLERVALAMGELARDQLMVFVLCDLERLPGAEVARILDAPVGTVWRRLHDARAAIRSRIARLER